MASRFTRRVRRAVRPTRHAINNMLWKRQIEISSDGGAKLVGRFFVPPRHKLTLQKMSLLLAGESTKDDDLVGEIGSFGLALDIGNAYDWQTTMSNNTLAEEEAWAVERMPATANQQSASGNQSLHSLIRKYNDATNAMGRGIGFINLEGYGDSNDEPVVWWHRHKFTHPMRGTGIISNSGDGGAKYTPVDDTGNVNVKRNIIAGENPMWVGMFIYAGSSENNTDYAETAPTFSGTEYTNWVKMHDAYAVHEAFEEPTNVEQGVDQYEPIDLPARLMTVRYVESAVDEGRPDKWNVMWKNSAYIAPPNDSIPGNVTYSGITRS